MKYRSRFGRTGVQVSQLCFGTMSFGGDADEADAARDVQRGAATLGINFFDTADQYNAGKSEEILGELMRGSRDDLVIATKCFNPTGKDVNARGSSRRHVTPRARGEPEAAAAPIASRSCYLHHARPAHAARGDTCARSRTLVRAGKVLYPAVSNYSAWQTQAALGRQERERLGAPRRRSSRCTAW